MLEALTKLYKELDFDNPDILMDIQHDYLTENTCRNGREVFWYLDELNNLAIYIDTLEFLSDAEIDSELC